MLNASFLVSFRGKIGGLHIQVDDGFQLAQAQVGGTPLGAVLGGKTVTWYRWT